MKITDEVFNGYPDDVKNKIWVDLYCMIPNDFPQRLKIFDDRNHHNKMSNSLECNKSKPDEIDTEAN